MIAAAGSGSGKTVITCALLQILKDRGMDPVSFKCGPDYIDPMFHRTVLGIDSHNLDTFLAGEDGVREVFFDALSPENCNTEEDAKFALIEGVMGIYDGMSPDSLVGSGYEIAQITNTPVILVVNAQGVGRTVTPIIKGILADDADKLIKGIILNRMSEAFFDKIRPVLRDEIAKTRDDVAILGAIPRTEDIGLESRHLGLKLPGEIADLRERIAHFAKCVEEHCDVNKIVESARGLSDREGNAKASTVMNFRENLVEASALDEVSHESSDSYAGTGAGARFRGNFIERASVTFAVARDEAFCFYYPENLKALEAMGAKLIEFSPIHDAKLPDDADALLFGGGYPELYLEQLSSNSSMLESIRKAIENGMPSIAECGGFMYLHSVIEDRDKKPFAMVGAIDGVCRFTGKLVNFGYCEITEGRLAGLRGHEFHYYESTAPGDDIILCKPSTGRIYRGMYISQNRLWGWPHLYYGKRNDLFCK